MSRKYISLIGVAIIAIGCRTDGTLTAFHPKKPIAVNSKKCPDSAAVRCQIDDSKIAVSVGKGETFGDVHGEIFLAEPMSATISKKLKCLAVDSPKSVSRIKNIKVNKVVVGYHNIGVGWQVESYLDVQTTFEDGASKSFNAQESIYSFTLSLGKNCSYALERVMDKYIESLR